MRLIIVESPVKSKTIQRFLGKDYQIAATLGHLRDLPKKTLGVEIEKDFEPRYVTIPGKQKTVKNLRALSQKVEGVILGLDLDREGESIAWHVVQLLKLKPQEYDRIVFSEITPEAINEALAHPRKIDLDLVEAQKARRILDRLVGYKLSPFLWRKIGGQGLSAGRVQSVAVRLVVERQNEIDQFTPQEYWTIEALLRKLKVKSAKLKVKELKAVLVKKNSQVIPKLGIKNKQQAEKIVQDLKDAKYQVAAIERKEVRRNPLPPFTTSTLQQEAWNRFRFPAKLTMNLAQQLYERGWISYHRTDSLNLSDAFQKAAAKIILQEFGKNYWPGFSRNFKTKTKGAQEAHEAIRPSHLEQKPEQLEKELEPKSSKLYQLIWLRALACQMSAATFDSTKVEIDAAGKKIKQYTFRATGQILKFDGFLRVYPLHFEEAELPDLAKNEILQLLKLIPSQHFTQPPPPYTEASLIKELEKNGIGRPSTYASILSLIQERNYVQKDEKKKLRPTEVGKIVNDLLIKHFPQIVDINFTAEMEENLDQIAQGKKEWVPVLRQFYQPFNENLRQKYQQVKKEDLVEKTDQVCAGCGKGNLVIRFGRFGRFYGCERYPECKYTAPLQKTLGIKCPQCDQGEIVEKKTKTGKIFYGCNRWPDCDFALWDKPTGEKCPDCSSLLVEKNRKIQCPNKSCDYIEK